MRGQGGNDRVPRGESEFCCRGAKRHATRPSNHLYLVDGYWPDDDLRLGRLEARNPDGICELGLALRSSHPARLFLAVLIPERFIGAVLPRKYARDDKEQIREAIDVLEQLRVELGLLRKTPQRALCSATDRAG